MTAERITELEHDCRVMAAWFKDLIEDEYDFSFEDEPALAAALKYIEPKTLTLTVFANKEISK